MIRFALFIPFIIASVAWSTHPAALRSATRVTPCATTSGTANSTAAVSRFSAPDTANPYAPGLQSSWASHANGTLSADEARTMLDSPITVSGKAGASYAITHFQFSYRQRVEYKDDSTGEMKQGWHLYSKDFYNTATVDPMWKSSIDSTLQSGETIYVDHIIVKDAQGKKAMAPHLELNIR